MLKKLLFAIFIILLLVTASSVKVFADEEIDVSGAEDFESLNVVFDDNESREAENNGNNPSVVVDNDDLKITENKEKNERSDSKKEVCGFELPENKIYDAQVIAVRRQLRVEAGENFRVKVFVKNTGNMPWFSNKSKCLGPKASLGTDRQRDRASSFYDPELPGWESDNRVGMDQLRVDSGQIASFTFFAKTGDKADVYKEYFTPVLKDLQWIDNALFSVDVMIGDSGESATDLRKKLSYANSSGSVVDIDLNAEKVIVVDLSEQKMRVKLGDYVVREFLVSTGAPATPTPTGETKIILKQTVRVGAKKPHYVMPKFQMFRAGGYGFHALPSLANDGGVFWTEARNHIGRPVSHGCIRVLPEDADWLFEFTDVGTKVVVER